MEFISHHIKEVSLHVNTSSKGNQSWNKNKEIYESLAMYWSSHKNSITQIAHHNTFHFLRYVHFSYAKCLFTNIQKNRIRWKVAYYLRQIHNLQANNSRILSIQNAKFKDVIFNTNIWRDYQVYISVPLKSFVNNFYFFKFFLVSWTFSETAFRRCSSK